jgi:hypothetical protein
MTTPDRNAREYDERLSQLAARLGRIEWKLIEARRRRPPVTSLASGRDRDRRCAPRRRRQQNAARHALRHLDDLTEAHDVHSAEGAARFVDELDTFIRTRVRS